MGHKLPASLSTFCLLVLCLSASPAAAQSSPDFLFGPPNGTIGFRTGWMFASAKSDLFSFVQEHLTVDRNDFNAPPIAVDVEVAVAPRASAIFGFEFSKASKSSEYRDFVDNQRLPIEQTTSLREVNFSGSVKIALMPRGREISSRAWVPSAVSPYVGAGGGVLSYEFLQYGDFVDFDDLGVFPQTFRSNGWSPSAHVFGGVDVKVLKRMYVSGEGRYLWAGATPDDDFSDFDRIDLAGFRVTVGIHYLF